MIWNVLGPVRSRGIRCVMTVHDFKLVCPTYRLVDGDGRHCTACVGASVVNVVRRRCQGGSRTHSALLAVEAGLHRALRSYESVDVLLCPSRYSAEILRQGGFGAQVAHLPLGYDATAIEPAATPGTGVLYAGRLSREKGVHHLIEAVAELDATLTICGDGLERSALSALGAARLGTRIRFTGHVAHEQVLELMRAARVVAVPSTWVENQPLVVLDAMAAGVAVVAGRTPALVELVEATGAGPCVDASDSRALAAALAGYLSDATRATAAARSGRQYVRRVHEMEHHLDSLEEFYRRRDR